MENAGLANDLPGRIIEEVALSRHHGGANGARRPAYAALHPPRQRIAGAVHMGI